LKKIIASSNPVTTNPFQSELNTVADNQLKQTILVLGYGGALVLILLVLAIASQKSDSLGQFLHCSRRGSFVTWVDFDIFFSKVHWTPAESTLPAQHSQTSFGGMMSLILILTVILVSIQLGISNLTPTFSSVVSIESPLWQPHGHYSLALTIFGVGLQNCGTGGFENDISVKCAEADWSGSKPAISFSYNSADGSCLATWTCPSCTLVSTSTTALRIIVANHAFSTHAQYKLTTPPFTTSASDVGSDSQIPLSVSGYIVSSDFSNLTAFQGGASVVTTTLTIFNVTLGSQQQRIAYQPTISSVVPGPVISADSFDISKQIGFEYRFELTQNSFSIVNIGRIGNVVNFVVLLITLAGSIVTGFSALLPQLEKRLNIATVWGAPALKGDAVRNWSEKISELELRLTKQFEAKLNHMIDQLQPNLI
jgi:hypothetical protein